MATEETAFFTDFPGVDQVRVNKPENFTAPDGDAVLCLGSDQAGHERRFKINDIIKYEQTSDRDTLENVLKFQTRIIGSSKLPTVSTLVEPFALTDGDNLSILVDDSLIPQNIVFTGPNYGSPAILTSILSEPFSIVAGTNLNILINGVSNPVLFTSATVNSAEEVSTIINSQITGATASVLGTTGTIRLITDDKGDTTSLEIIGGTAAPSFNFPPSASFGIGNVTTAKAHEIARTINSQITGVVANSTDEGEVTIISNRRGRKNRVQVIGGTAASFFDFVELFWRLRLNVNGVAMATYEFGPGRIKDFTNLGCHLSNIGPDDIKIQFVLKLVIRTPFTGNTKP